MKVITNCAQRGCTAEVELADGASLPTMCPVCNQPLIDPPVVQAEVSQAKLDDSTLGEDGPILADTLG